MAGSTAPIKNFDPLNLATLGSDQTLAWFRAAELKHSRVAMVATTGYLVQASGVHFPGMLSSDVSFESLSTMKPLDAWCAMPAAGKWWNECESNRCFTSSFLHLSLPSLVGQAQIIFTIFLAELISESADVHYTKGGPLPTIVFPPINFAGGMSPEQLEKRQNSELNNGRLAMISIMSFIAAANIPGSVPALIGNPMF